VWTRLGSLRLSWLFRLKYGKLQGYLHECRTSQLDDLLAAGREKVRAERRGEARPWQEFFTEWNERDERLTRECANLLDSIAAFTAVRWRAPRGRAMRELLDLRARLELWALVAMFVTERPRSFYRFPLPRLTMLYRYYPLQNLFPQQVGREGPVLVCDSDLWLELRLHCMALPSGIEEVRRWGLGQHEKLRGRADAGNMLRAAIERLEISAGMNEKQWETSLDAAQSTDRAEQATRVSLVDTAQSDSE